MSRQAQPTIGDRLKQAKETHFIGRDEECRIFEQALSDSDRSWLILNIFGQGGIGKSTLLDAYRRIAEAHDAHYLYLDTPDFGAAPEPFIGQLRALLQLGERDDHFAAIRRINAQRPVVIAIDSFEEIGEMQRWLREGFLPHLPERCLIVIAGRHPLSALWQPHPAWQTLIRPLALGNFDYGNTHTFLRRNGIHDPALLDGAWRCTGGYPLALSLSILLAQRIGQQAIAEATHDADIVLQLTRRWLREIPDAGLRPFIEAAAIVRHFNQALLQQISGQPMSDADFEQLLGCSFVRRGLLGWSLHGLVSHALEQALMQCNPERHRLLRLRALTSLAQAAINPSAAALERNVALQEFFYLLGDGLVRAALYDAESNSGNGLYLASAGHDDIDALEAYMQAWRLERGVLARVDVELIDRSSNLSIQEQIVAEPREPELIHIGELIDCFPGAIRILKDQSNRILGFTIVLPINADSIGYLSRQPVSGNYFRSLPHATLNELQTPPGQTQNWFVRLIDTRDPADNNARAALFRDLTALLIRPARFVTSTPLPLYQALLSRFGFKQLDLAPHHDFGKDRPAPFFELDLRGQRLAQHLQNLIKQHLGAAAELPFESLLAAIPGESTAVPGAQTANHQLMREIDAEPLDLEALSTREREVALAAVEGLPNCSIAARLDIGEVTVKKHMGQIFRKLGLRNRAELIRRFWAQAEKKTTH